MRIQKSTIAASVIAHGLALAIGSGASAQVVVDMPAPPKKAAPAALAPAVPMAVPASAPTPADATTVSTSSSTVTLANPASSTVPAYLARPSSSPDVGYVALTRYSSARAGTRDTYLNDGSYWNGGVRVYSYPRYFPQYVWGPWYGGAWWGWPGLGFHNHGCW